MKKALLVFLFVFVVFIKVAPAFALKCFF